MYHFAADHPPVPVRLSFRSSIPGHIRQYLKQFQIDAIQFMHNFLAKGEFCVYNDESGLGKQAAVAVLLDVACGNKKSLIVVQNDDKYVNGWEFHFSVLTNSSVMVIKESKDSTNTPHNIYIAKWSTLRSIDDLSKFDFDYIILDNRGQMLNNTFCTSMLLKNYERKVNMLISSVDITSDLKLLHNVLKLGGRLEPRYSSFKTFEEKFKLPDAKELAFKKIDLEEYFLKRERLADYCKNFRLRRYCHQYEQHLPLAADDRYKINLDTWRERQTATTSESSSVEITAPNRQDERVRDTQELFEEYCRQRRKQQEKDKQNRQMQQFQKTQQQNDSELETICSVDDEVAFINATPSVTHANTANSRESSDEVLIMSPLLLVSDSEDTNDVPQICNDANDDTDIVDLSSSDEAERHKGKSTTSKDKSTKNIKSKTFRTEVDKLKQDVATNLKYQNETTPKRRTRHNDEKKNITPKEAKSNISQTKTNKTTKEIVAEKKENTSSPNKNSKDNKKSPTEKSSKTTENDKRKPVVKTLESDKENKNKTPEKNITPEKSKTLEKNKNKQSKSDKSDLLSSTPPRTSRSANKTNQDLAKNKSVLATPLTSRTRNATKNENSASASSSNKTPTTPIMDIVIKKEPDDFTTPQAKSKRSNSNESYIRRIKRELDIDHVVLQRKETRSAQRLTRSAGCPSRYAKKNSLFNNDKTKPKKNAQVKPANATVSKSKNSIVDTQAPIIPLTCSQDFEPIECAQRLSDILASENNSQRKTAEFLVPSTPPSMRNSLIPSSFLSSNGFFNESDVMFVPTSKNVGNKTTRNSSDVIIVSESDTDSSSMNLASTSRRTRALKPRRLQKALIEDASKVPTFSQLLAQHNTRTSAKSPDLFSNCSDLTPLTCSQKLPSNNEESNAPFEGFKIFGSEVKQLQQHYALTKTQSSVNNTGKKPYRDRSCLDILENMFEPANKKQKTISITTTNEPKTTNTTIGTPSKKSTKKTRTQTPIVPQHPIEAIAEAKAQQEAKQRRSLAPPLSEDEIFEITNNGTFGSVMRLHSNGEISPVLPTQKSTKQRNKITKYFQGGLTQNLTGSQEDSGNNSEAGTPSKKQTQQNGNLKKSPKPKCSSTQATKLTKWFTKNTPTKLLQTQASKSNSASGAMKKSTTATSALEKRVNAIQN